MPYMPPLHHPPASSAPVSPKLGHRSLLQVGPRPQLPRSASYLNRHRRTPSITEVFTTSSNFSSIPISLTDAQRKSLQHSSHPARKLGGIPSSDTIILPPASASCSNEDGEISVDAVRESEAMRELRDAVDQINLFDGPSSSPTSSGHISPINVDCDAQSGSTYGDNVGRSIRKKGHHRSATESSLMLSPPVDNNVVRDQEDDFTDFKPQMVRKKSGELVRPALRVSHRRPSSMPGTPTFSKAVHFDSHLEHVRHFLQVDRPLAVSADTSPISNFENEGEYPFPATGQDVDTFQQLKWELVTSNFPHDPPSRAILPVHLGKVWLSPDGHSMLGSISVLNLAFHKIVTCRFTLDHWKTVSEVNADFSHTISSAASTSGRDCFSFSIKLSDTVNLESKTLFFCIRYFVNGQEFWDNNDGANFQVKFQRKSFARGRSEKEAAARPRKLNGPPRENQDAISFGRASFKSPSASKAFSFQQNDDSSCQPLRNFLCESAPTNLRLKTKSTSSLATDNLASDLPSPSGAAFSNRYDFGASLSAAMQVTKPSAGKEEAKADFLYMKRNVRGPSDRASSTDRSPPSSTLRSPAPSLPSASYEELVNKYCFYGTSQKRFNTPITDLTPVNGSNGIPHEVFKWNALAHDVSTLEVSSLRGPGPEYQASTPRLLTSRPPMSTGDSLLKVRLRSPLAGQESLNEAPAMPLAHHFEASSGPTSSSSGVTSLSSKRFQSQHLALLEHQSWTIDRQTTAIITN